MENTRSLLSRFSGLVFFIIALAVVGLLVFFTVRSTEDDTSDDSGMTSSQQSDQVALPNLDSEPRVVVVDGNQSASGGEVAGSSDSGLPNTGPQDAILPALAIALVTWQFSAYIKSRREVQSSLRV